MKTQNHRIILIVWKWRDLKAVQLTAADIQNFTGPHTLADWKTSGRYDEYQVVSRTEQGEINPEKTDAKVVRLSISPEATPAYPVLESLVNQYLAQGSTQLYLFLHRNDGYGEADVRHLLQHTKVHRCFLFSEGADFIYYPVQEIGLLSDDGRFYQEPPTLHRPEVMVADKEHKYVFQPHFDKVWTYYTHEIGTKLLELREDLLDHWLERLSDLDEPTATGHWQHLLDADHGLRLRVQNFLGNTLRREEIRQLNEHERHRQKSYRFDDWRENLSQAARASYEEVRQSLRTMLQPDGLHATAQPARSQLRTLQTRFNDLLNVVTS